MGNARRRLNWPTAALVSAVIASVAALLLGCGGGSDQSTAAAQEETQTVSFQKPEDPGPDPFTEPADVDGEETVRVSAPGEEQPFGGSGSNRVCDRDKLIRFLEANPERMREWARVLGVSPTFTAVKKYIATLHPVTLTRDTQVTNHAFQEGHAVAFQAILQAGTAVLVDKYGTPVVRCYCGNPLKPAVYTKTAKCTGCPPDYAPPKQCRYGHFDDYDRVYYRRKYYDNRSYDEVFILRHRRSRFSDCYAAYPDPPVVTIIDVFVAPEPAPVLEPEPQTPETTPAPPPEPTPAPPPETTPNPPPATETTPAPDICNDGLDNEDVSGLVDGADPNCQ